MTSAMTSATAQGAGFIELSGMPIFQKTQLNPPVPMGGSFEASPDLKSETGLGYDLRGTVGFAFWNKVVVGFSANAARLSLKRDMVVGGAESMNQVSQSFEMGPTMGFVLGGFHVLGTYFVYGSAKLKDNRVGDDGLGGGEQVLTDYMIENKLSSGFQVNMGYAFAISNVLRFGPSLIYRSVIYKKQSFTNNRDPASNFTDRAFAIPAREASVTPMLTLEFVF